MLKRKTFYIIMLIVFSVILVGEAAICLFVPSSTRHDMSGMPSFAQPQATDNAEQPAVSAQTGSVDEEAQTEAMPQSADIGGQTQQEAALLAEDTDADAGAEAQTGAGTETASPSQAAGLDSSSLPAGFDASAMPDMSGRGRSASGLLGTFRSLWLPIIAVCLLGDAFCIYMLIRLKKRGGDAHGGDEENDAAAGGAQTPGKGKKNEYTPEQQKKRRMRMRIAAVAAVIVFIAAFALLPLLIPADGSSMSVDERVISGTAETGAITTGLSIGGTLSDDESVNITVPGAVKIKSYAVKNGDTVAEGDMIATVDKASVMLEIAALQEAMDELDGEIESAMDETSKSTLTMPADGRVKAVFAKKGDSVVDVMYDSSSLMLVSLDGLMAVDISSDKLSVGDGVKVTLSDGEIIEGRVASAVAGTASVTVTDEGTEYGEKVTVTDSSGSELGAGALYIHSELKITGYAGTVTAVYASAEQELSAGKKLLSITEKEQSATYAALYNERLELEERMSVLTKVYQDGGVTAAYAGTISGISDDYDNDETASASAAETADEAADDVAGASANAGESSIALLSAAQAPSGEGAAVLLAGSPTGQDDPTYVNYAAKVTAVAYGAISIKTSKQPVSIDDYASISVDEGTLTETTQVTPDASAAVYVYEKGAWRATDPSEIAAGDTLVFTYDASGTFLWIVCKHGEASSDPNKSDDDNKNNQTPTAPSSPSGGSSAAEEEEEYTLNETDICDIIPADYMMVDISVDEMDILSLSLGQTAKITLDSIEGHSFEGEITEIDRNGTNDGGNSKYSVKLKIERTAEMLYGMNASVSIDLSAKEGVIVIPEAALAEEGAEVYVYTAYDAHTDQLKNPAAVTTGASDGISVEITSGLEEGAAYYYRYADTITYSFN